MGAFTTGCEHAHLVGARIWVCACTYCVCSSIWMCAYTSGWVLTHLVGAHISGWVLAYLGGCIHIWMHIWWGSAPCLPCILLAQAFHQRPHDAAPAPKCSAQHIPSRKSFNAMLLGFFFPNPPLHPGQRFNFWNFLPCECLISQWHHHTGSGVHS